MLFNGSTFLQNDAKLDALNKCAAFGRVKGGPAARAASNFSGSFSGKVPEKKPEKLEAAPRGVARLSLLVVVLSN